MRKIITILWAALLIMGCHGNSSPVDTSWLCKGGWTEDGTGVPWYFYPQNDSDLAGSISIGDLTGEDGSFKISPGDSPKIAISLRDNNTITTYDILKLNKTDMEWRSGSAHKTFKRIITED